MALWSRWNHGNWKARQLAAGAVEQANLAAKPLPVGIAFDADRQLPATRPQRRSDPRIRALRPHWDGCRWRGCDRLGWGRRDGRRQRGGVRGRIPPIQAKRPARRELASQHDHAARGGIDHALNPDRHRHSDGLRRSSVRMDLEHSRVEPDPID